MEWKQLPFWKGQVIVMSNATSTRRLTAGALCLALAVLIPQLFHAIPNAGSVFLPMHVPVLICGFLCGWPYGLACGLLAPALSSLLTGMPPAPILPGMICELGMYGFVTGFLSKRVRTGKPTLDVYCVLLPAMLLGRAVSGLLNGLVFRAGEYTMTMFLTASFVTALPGIVIQVLLIPVLLLALAKADLYAYAS